MSDETLKRCMGCHLEFPLWFFRLNPDTRHGHAYVPERRAKCKACEQEKRDLKKDSLEGRCLVKAWNTIRTHAKKYHLPAPVFARTYGWQPPIMAKDFAAAFRSGTCAYCRKVFSRTARGLAGITIDILDPTREPFYRKLACDTCNAEKSQVAPGVWERHLQLYERRAKELARRAANPYKDLPLFRTT